MASTIIHVALLIWSGLFIIAGAMLMIASQVGHLAEAIETANGAADAIRQPRQPVRMQTTITEARVIVASDSHLMISMPPRTYSGFPTRPARTLAK